MRLEADHRETADQAQSQAVGIEGTEGDVGMSKTYTRLADVSELITKGTTPTTLGFHFTDQGIGFLRVQNIEAGQVIFNQDVLYIDDQTHGVLKRSQIKPGDVLVSIAGSIGRSAVVPDDAPELNCNQAVAIVRVKDAVFQSYLRYWLESSEAQTQMRGSTVTGTISNLSLTQLGNLKIPLPPIAQQQRIATILDKAESLRSLRRQTLAQLDTLTQSIFLEMFGDPATNPKGWIKVKLESVGDVQGGLQLSASRSKLPCKVPYLRVANVYRDVLELNEIKTMCATESEVVRTLLQTNDLLIVEGHGNPSEIGRCALWDGSIPNCIHQNHLIRLRFNLEKVSPIFVSRYLNSAGGRCDLLRAGKTTSGLNTISVSNVRNAQLLLPPLSLQQTFARRVEAVEQLKATHRESLAHLDALFASLQHRAFRGEL